MWGERRMRERQRSRNDAGYDKCRRFPGTGAAEEGETKTRHVIGVPCVILRNTTPVERMQPSHD